MATAREKQRYLEHRIAEQQRIERIVSGWLLPRLGWQGPARLTPVAHGHNLVYYLEVPERPGLVVRAGLRRSKFRRRIRLHRYLGRRGISVPTVRAHNLGLFDRRQDGLMFSAEDRLPGTPILEADDPLAVARMAGEQFAILHGIRPFLRRMIPNSSWTRRRLERWMRAWAAGRVENYARHDAETAERVRRWLDEWPQAAWRHRPGLCLGDVGKQNVIGTGQDVGIVDLVGLMTSSAPIELGRVRHMLLSNREAEWKQFLCAYDRVAAPAVREETRRLRRFAEVLYLLKHNLRNRRSSLDAPFHGRLLALLETAPEFLETDKRSI